MFDLEPKIKKWLKLALKGVLLLIFVSVLAWFFVINPYLIRQEKKRFDQAAISLEQLAQEIQTKIGPANEVIQDNSCGRANLKSEKGPLSCSVSSSLTYAINNTEDANILLTEASTLNTNELREGPLATDIVFVSPSKSKSTQIIYQNIGVIESFRCVTSYEYSFDDTLEVTSKHNLKIIVNCGGAAKTEYFPIES
ncbi:hypothetical protein H0X10_01395 [Candidatus Saccharibacteria bacterium]|nr:hypothetical protein [Candidatus Saccharibacteria bacterium]